MLLPDRHIGRSVIHLRSLENFPPVFTKLHILLLCYLTDAVVIMNYGKRTF